jgi:transcriptional regulator with XRE-family HTH domain
MEHEDWVRLGRAFAEARDARGLTQVEVAAQIGVSRGPIQAIERGEDVKKPTGTMRSYARLLDWTDDSIEQVLAGGEPTLAEVVPAEADAAPEPEAADVIAPRSGLPLVVREIMDSGEIWDTTISHVTEGGADVRVISITVFPPDEAPDLRRANREAWEGIQPRLKAIEKPKGGEPSQGEA